MLGGPASYSNASTDSQPSTYIGQRDSGPWQCHLQRGDRTLSRHKPHAGDGTRLWANHGSRGVCESALKPRQAGKAHGRNATVPNRTWENRPSGIIGGPAKRSHGGIVNPSCNRKGKCGNPAPTAGARGFYPNHHRVIVKRGRRIRLNFHDKAVSAFDLRGIIFGSRQRSIGTPRLTSRSHRHPESPKESDPERCEQGSQ